MASSTRAGERQAHRIHVGEDGGDAAPRQRMGRGGKRERGRDDFASQVERPHGREERNRPVVEERQLGTRRYSSSAASTARAAGRRW